MPGSLTLTTAQPTVLLTGFGAFPGIAENVSARLAHALADRARHEFPDHRFDADVLPTQWRSAPQRAAALLAAARPVLVLHFGVAKDARGFRIESRGANACRWAEDAAGLPPLDSLLIAGARPHYDATLPIAAIIARLEEMRLPVSLSHDAGSYICNAVLYHALHMLAQTNHPCRAGFIHIPATLDGPPLTFDEAVAGSLAIIDVVLGAGARARPN
jgi:pyroglutamyl-peptidase